MIFLFDIFICFFIIMTTMHLSKKMNCSPVFSSGAVTLFYLILCSLLFSEGFMISRKIEFLIFGSSFAGMCSDEKLRSIKDILLCSILFYLFFVFVTPLLPNIGGALGLTAFLSVCSVQMIIFLRKPSA